MKYYKIITVSETYYAKDIVTKGKQRQLTEASVAKFFKSKPDCTIEIVFEGMDREKIIITPSSNKELIQKYLGKAFLV